MNQNREYELMEMQNSLNKAYYGKLEEVGMQHKRYAHDLKEYLQTIGGLAVKCQSDEIVNILKDMEIEIDNIPDKIYTNNSTLNALLCEKELQAQKKNIDIHIMVEPELKLEHIKNGDLIVMAGNLLDNAIEAAEQCKEDRKIDLKFYEANENFIVLDIENTYENTIKKIGEQYISTKKDNKNHGIGIKSVREIAGQYGGTLYMEQKDGNFISILTLSKMYSK
jgi:sensor histidine kinase regulating citrate/malate metabolism